MDCATQGELGCCPLQTFYGLIRRLHVVRSILRRCSTDCHACSGACTGIGFDRDPHGETTAVRRGQNASIVGDRVAIGIIQLLREIGAELTDGCNNGGAISKPSRADSRGFGHIAKRQRPLFPSRCASTQRNFGTRE